MKRKTSIILLTYNNFHYTKDCIESIRRYTEKDSYEIIVVDNASTDETKDWLKEQEDIKMLLKQENVGFPKGCNLGISLAEKENDILLLNNDTIVTKNWLSNLQKCLHSKKDIGAVGAISNHDANLQGASFTYQDFEKMQELAAKNNQSDPNKWEEKACLIGYCMLIKREVINKLQGLDEEYSPGYIEDNDLSLQIISLGYRLMLCHDAFIHHYLGTAFRKDKTQFQQLLQKNRGYFQEKWGFSCFEFDKTKNASIFLADPPIKILDYACGIGVSSLRIKYYFPQADITGLEIDPKKRAIVKHFIPVIENLKLVGRESFDTILIGNTLEEIEDPLSFLKMLHLWLKPNGSIVGEIHNIATLSNINLLLEDQWYYSHFEKSNHFTKTDLKMIFSSCGYEEDIFYPFESQGQKTNSTFASLLQNEPNSFLNKAYYAFRFRKK